MKILSSLGWVISGLLSLGSAGILFFGVEFTNEPFFWEQLAHYLFVAILFLAGLACLRRAICRLRG